jgi:hypothetical protein
MRVRLLVLPALALGIAITAGRRVAGDEDPLAKERKANEGAYATLEPAFAKKHTKEWAAIAGGKLVGAFDSFEAADEAVRKAAPDAKHAFIYEAGSGDEREAHFDFSIRRKDDGTALGWLEVSTLFFGRRLEIQEVMSAGMTDQGMQHSCAWKRKGKSLPLRHDGVFGFVALDLAGPGGTTKAEFESSGAIMQDLVVTEDLVRTLGLARWSIPTDAMPSIPPEGVPPHVRFRRVRCRVRIPELDVDTLAVAYVVPPEVQH